MKNDSFSNTFDYKVIYIFKIYDEIHKGILKIGETTLKSNKEPSQLLDNSDDLNYVSLARIREYTNTIGVQEDLLYTTLAINNKNKTFTDKDVHKLLKNSGISKYDFKNSKSPEEWFEINIDTAINAINAVKEGRKSLYRTEVIENYEDIEFRPEQIAAIDQTLKRFEKSDKMLWNAKMRFGKTLSALEVIKRMSRNEKFNLQKAIILTHRPVVDEGWFEDFTKIFHNSNEFLYGSKKRERIEDLVKTGKKFIYFASMQDLRESNKVGGVYLKNDTVFETDWDLIVIDEAHEGTRTELGLKVLDELLKSDKDHNAKQLHLSGTPFNLLRDFENKDIYTWDYVMEQKAKEDWMYNHPLEPNPYEDLPKMNILTYNLSDYLPAYQDVADKAFNFKDFFKVWTGDIRKDGKELNDKSRIGKFINEADVNKFLNLLTAQSEESMYPFSNKKFINNFKHSFWILPGVKEARALKELMKKNEVFSLFNIVNVAGTGDDNGDEALEAVEKAIGPNPDETYTITLSCGKLTTGVTVKAWSAVLYLAGSFSTSASSYLQTIFRVQSPANYGGKIKTNCYVFDFAPDRTLKMIAQAGDLSTKAGSTGSQETMKLLLNYCPVISMDGSTMKPYDVNSMLEQLKKAYIERVVNNGFDDVKIYNDNLLKLNDIELTQFEKLKKIIGSTEKKKQTDNIPINNQGFTEEEWEIIEKSKKKKKTELTEQEKELLKELKEKKKEKEVAVSILRGISIRIPLLIYGANISEQEDITIDNFTEIVDDISWKEFMPRGVTKEIFKSFSKYYDNEIFIGAGRRIRNIAKHADSLSPVERAVAIADLFSSFRNPDKETVLTPWNTVNKHLGDTIGGYNFFDKNYLVSIEDPRLINHGEVTSDILFNTSSQVLEINSKTGLYPLYITISLFKQRCLNYDEQKLSTEIERELWDKTIDDNIYVLCKTDMARSITKRTLVGYRNKNINTVNIPNITELLQDNPSKLLNIINSPTSWNKEGSGKMKFDAIIGNPPYQESLGNEGGNSSKSKAVYHLFLETAMKLHPNYISLIMPSRWMTKSTEGISDKWIDSIISSNNFIVMHDYLSSKECFSNVDIKGGVCYFLMKSSYNGKCKYFLHEDNDNVNCRTEFLNHNNIGIVIRDNVANGIIEKIDNKSNNYYAINDKNFSYYVGPKDFFTNKTKLTSSWDGYVIKQNDTHNIKYYYNQKGKSYIGYISEKDIPKNLQAISKWKVYIPAAGGSGNDKNVLGKPFCGEPNSVCSQTYLVIGYNHNLTSEECKNICKYIRTKFFRYLVSIKKKTQNGPKMVYQFVPIQDFTNNSDINWNCNLDIIDKQLYKKYNLTEDQINYIEVKIDY